MDQRVTIAVDAGVADVRLTRTDKVNALDAAMFVGIADVLEQLSAMPDLRCVVLSGEGRGFCAGLDMALMANGAEGIDLATRRFGPANLAQHVAWGWRALRVPVIAALHGVAMGGGLQIAAGADIRIAHPATRLSIREVHWGIVPDMAGFPLWRGTVRDDVLRELVYTARVVEGEEARRLGLVTRLADDPVAEALALARTIAGYSPAAIRAAKRLATLSADADAAAILSAESAEQAALLGAAEQVEQVRANLEGRSAVF